MISSSKILLFDFFKVMAPVSIAVCSKPKDADLDKKKKLIHKK